ncbi:MlaD family protein [Nocardia huaxiensis]|uniref:MCE family protein n=1 Tax=Nocardia huaxiensis TaxID=2755382 RepID=A0A7D6ZCH2_9NOCA|nr:MlaD family protein [Nocardia huaxiensis]QLY27679.1 MCE family protein [Nocardia huaxiensis]UFS98932.1 MlaD family protein [Nocardia huaxiensis]
MGVFQDHSGRAAKPWALRLRGLVLAIVIVVVTMLVSSYARGGFADRFALTVDAATLGEGLAPGAEVKFRGFAIGTVKAVDTVGYGHQRIELEIDRKQAGALTDDVTARFTSSNVFGSSAIELVAGDGGEPLREGAVLQIGENATNATVAGVFRRAARLTQVLDSATVHRLFDLMLDNADSLGPVLQSFFETARLLADGQQAPLAHYLTIGKDMTGALADLTPSAGRAILAVLEQAAYFGDPDNRARTNKATDGVDQTVLVGISDLLQTNNPDLEALLSTVLDLAVPISASIGTVAPAYNRVPNLLRAMDGAFPVVDGRVQLQLELIAKTMPYLADSLNADSRNGGTR